MPFSRPNRGGPCFRAGITSPAGLPVRALAGLVSCAIALICAAPSAAQAGFGSRLVVHRVDPVAAVASPTGTSSRAASAVNALGPSDIQAAYRLPSSGAPGQTIAVVSAYDDPAAEADLSKYLAEFRLPRCTTRSGCFRRVNQEGKAGAYPGSDPTGGNWIVESALGVETARGVCGSCSILLVEANGADQADLSAAVATAARLGAQVIETSFSPPEQAGDTSSYASDYTHTGSVVVAATGDSGYTGGVTFPAAFPDVIAVGGTHLNFNSQDNYGNETVWNSAGQGSGSGCSLYTPAAVWQATFARSVGCGSMRAVADVSAVADPGELVYITNVEGTKGGAWYQVGGTSLSSPVIAAALGLAGGGGGTAPRLLYERAHTDPGAFHDIVTGATVGCVGKQPICAARRGYDGPTGLGTPNGLAAFFPPGGAVNQRDPHIGISAPGGHIQTNPRWTAPLSLQNHNPFTVSASISLRSTRRLLVDGRGRTVTFASKRLELAPLGGANARLTIAGTARSLLQHLGTIAVQVTVTVRGSRGRAVSVRKQFQLYAP